jgi:hypothetical protein
MNGECNRRSALAALALLFVLPGCGGSDDAAPTSSPAIAPAIPPLALPSALDDNRQIGEVFWPNGATATGGNGQPVGGLACGAVDTTFHVHAHLSIFLNGRALAIPANVGIVAATPERGACVYLLHTHDLSGKLHLEGPAPTTYTLGQFFAVWGQTLSRNDVAGITSLPVVIYVTDNNRDVAVFTGDPAAIELKSHREITIQIGSPIAQIPNYTWSGP